MFKEVIVSYFCQLLFQMYYCSFRQGLLVAMYVTITLGCRLLIPYQLFQIN